MMDNKCSSYDRIDCDMQGRDEFWKYENEHGKICTQVALIHVYQFGRDEHPRFIRPEPDNMPVEK